MKEKNKNNQKSSSEIEKEISDKIYKEIKEKEISDFELNKIILKEIENKIENKIYFPNSIIRSENWQKHYIKERIRNSIKERRYNFLPTSWGKRFLNYILDIFGLYIFGWIFGYVIVFIFGWSGYTILMSINKWFLNILLYVCYYVFFESIWSKTPSKIITRTRVIMENGEKPDFKTIFIRTLIRIVPLEPLSFIFPTSEHPRGWHDKWSKTFVVDDVTK